MKKINEAKFNTNDLLDSIESAYKKGGLKGVIQGGKEFGLTDKTTVDELLDSAKSMFGADLKKAAAEIKGFLKPQDYAKYKTKMESVEETDEIVSEAKEKMLTGPGKRDPKRLIGIYTMTGKWVKDVGSENEAKAIVNKSWGESVEVEGEEVTEAVDVDARTGMFRRTLTRLEQTRAKREGKTDKYQGMYDDGSGKGVIMPKPISFNKESRRFTVEIDGRTKGLREAMKRVEMYRKLREEKKKKTIMGGWKEEVEETTEPTIVEATNLTKGQIMDAVGMQGSKFEVSEEELSPKQKAYRAFFTKALKKFGKDSPASMDDGEKKKFFDYVKANWKG